LAYAASPTETRVVFDRPLDAAQFEKLKQWSSITQGRYVSAGERFESFRPGYQAVKDQQATPHSKLPIESAVLAEDRQSVVLKTSARVEADSYAITLPEGSRADRPQNA